MLLVAAILALAFLATRRDVVFVGVVLWAFIGIAVKQSSYSHNFALLGLFCIACVATGIVVFRIAPRKSKK
jgi:hypothetical protein